MVVARDSSHKGRVYIFYTHGPGLCSMRINATTYSVISVGVPTAVSASLQIKGESQK